MIRPTAVGDARVARVAGDVHDVKDTLAELKGRAARTGARIRYLATKAEIAQLPSNATT